MTYKHPATPTGWAVTNSTSPSAARQAINVSGISVLDYIPNPADTASHNAGFQAAIDAAIQNGNQVIVPPGDWHITGLTIPGQKAIKIVGSSAEYLPNTSVTPGNGVRLRRVGTGPALTIQGGGALNSTSSWWQTARNVVVEDLTIYDGNTSATTPLVYINKAILVYFRRVILSRQYSGGIALLDIESSMDLRFTHCHFVGGGQESPRIGAIRIRGTVASGAPEPGMEGSSSAASNALWFTECQSESYYGPAIEIPNTVLDPSFNRRNDTMFFINHKGESWVSGNSPHMYIGRAAGIVLQNAYFTHKTTQSVVVDVNDCYDLFGTVRIIKSGNTESIEPTNRIRFGPNCLLVNLNVEVGANCPADANVVNLEAQPGPDFDVRVIGPSKRVNNKAIESRHEVVATRTQRSLPGNVNCQYVFAKDSLNLWALGNPVAGSPPLSFQNWDISTSDSAGNSQRMASFQVGGFTSGTNPVTADHRLLTLDGYLNLPANKFGWVNFRTQLADPVSPSGGMQLYSKNNAGGRAQLYLLNDGGAHIVETRRALTATSTSSLIVNSNTTTHYTISALSGPMTIGAPTGIPESGQRLTFIIRDNGTVRALTWNAAFVPVRLTLPTSTIANEWLVVQCEWNASAAAWLVVETQGGATGQVQRNVQTVTAATTLGANGDYVVFISGASGAVTLPTAVGNTGKYTLKNIHTADKTVSTTSSQTIDGGTLTIRPNDSFDLMSDGTNWRIV